MMKYTELLLAPALITLTLGVARNSRAQDQQQQYPQQQQYSQQQQYPQQQPNAQGWDWNNDSSERQFRSFDMFLHNHPYISKKLWERPSRVNDLGFINGNKELRQWLDDHPAAASAFRADPEGFMQRESHFQVYGADFDAGDQRRGELARFDWFLDGHPEIRHDLMRKPDLVDKRDYLDRHPDLQECLSAHPGLAAELQDHPRQFMDREARYEHI
jgi:hypothetical protein